MEIIKKIMSKDPSAVSEIKLRILDKIDLSYDMNEVNLDENIEKLKKLRNSIVSITKDIEGIDVPEIGDDSTGIEIKTDDEEIINKIKKASKDLDFNTEIKDGKLIIDYNKK